MHKDGPVNLDFSFLFEVLLASKFPFYIYNGVFFTLALVPYYMTILVTLATDSTKFMLSNLYYEWHLTLLRASSSFHCLVWNGKI